MLTEKGIGIISLRDFEAIRKKLKGGTLIAVHKGLYPVLDQYFEQLVVEVKFWDTVITTALTA